MARIGRAQPFPPQFIKAPQVGAVTAATISPSRTVQVQVVQQAANRDSTFNRRGRAQAFGPQFIKAPQVGAVTVTTTPSRTVTVSVVGQAVPRAARRRLGIAKFITSPQTTPFPGQPAGKLTVALQRIRRPLARATWITAPQVGAVTAPVITAGQKAGVYVVTVSEVAVARAARRRVGVSTFITAPQVGAVTPPATATPAGKVQVVLARIRRPLAKAQFITPPQVGAVTPPTVTIGQPAGIYVTVVSQAVQRETYRLGRGLPFPPKLIVPPQVGAVTPAPPVTVSVSGEGFNPILRRQYVVRGGMEPELIALLMEHGIITEEEAAIMLAMS